MNLFRTADFSLSGVYRVDVFNAVPGAFCNLCRTFGGLVQRAPATTRVILYGGDVPASWERGVALLTDAANRPISSRAETTAVKNRTRSEHCLCARHRDKVVDDALHRRLSVISFEQYPTKYDYGSLAELPGEWQETYRKVQESREERKPRLVMP